MIATPIPHNLELMVSHGHRSPGLHVSDIYNALYKKLDRQRYGDGPMNQVMVELGLAWEAALEKALIERPTFEGEVIERPAERQTEEGIYYSPDLFIYPSEVWEDISDVRLGEIKLKWMSSADAPREVCASFPSKYDKDFTQMKAYCHNIGTTHARYYVFYVNGGKRKDMEYRFGPHEPYVWDIEFEQAELDEEWAMLMNFAKSEGML